MMPVNRCMGVRSKYVLLMVTPAGGSGQISAPGFGWTNSAVGAAAGSHLWRSAQNSLGRFAGEFRGSGRVIRANRLDERFPLHRLSPQLN